MSDALSHLSVPQEYRREPVAQYLFRTAGIMDRPVREKGNKATFLTWDELTDAQQSKWRARADALLHAIDSIPEPVA